MNNKKRGALSHVYGGKKDISKDSLGIRVHKSMSQQKDRTSIVSDHENISYSELRNCACNLAAALNERGLKAEDRVAVILKKDWRQIACVIGIIFLGAAYVPFEHNILWTRLLSCLKASGVRAVITDEYLADKISTHVDVTISVHELDKDTENNKEPYKNDLSDPCAVLFTSGSTGKPKGVVLTHGGVINSIDYQNFAFDLTSADRIFAISNYCFDMSMYDIFGSLLHGAKIIMPDSEFLLEPSHWLELIEEHSVTLWNSAPTLWDIFLTYMETLGADRINVTIRIVQLAGEHLRPELCLRTKAVMKRAEIYNGGGLTETTLNIQHKITDTDLTRGVIPYGTPIWNTDYYILDEKGEVVSIGERGIIYNGGIGLAKGYTNSEFNTDKFIYHEELQQRLFQTGDLGCVNENGLVEIYGRIDNQVKIEGKRIELQEIESVLLSHPRVSNAVTVLVDEAAIKKLVAFVITDCTSEEIKHHCAKTLPAYMLPSEWHIADGFPVLDSGKVDRKRLEGMITQNVERECIEDEGTNTSPEDYIRALWALKLNVDFIDDNEPLQNYGGHSLVAMTIISDVNVKFSAGIKLSQFMKTPTVRHMTELIEKETGFGKESLQENFTCHLQYRYEPFAMNDLQISYFLGRDDVYLGNTATQLYAEYAVSDVDLNKLEQTLEYIVDRHEMLRCIYVGDLKLQIIKNTKRQSLRITDLRGLFEDEQTLIINEKRGSLINSARDMDEYPAFHFSATLLTEKNSIIHILLDSTMVDGVSFCMLVEDFIRRYQGQELPKQTISFRDYNIALMNYRNSKQYLNAKKYWQDKIKNLPSAPPLPLYDDHNNRTSYGTIRKHVEIEAKIWSEIKRESMKNNITPTVILLTAFAEVIAKWSGERHFTINVPVFNRIMFHQEVEQLAGQFGSLIFLEVFLDPDKSFLDNAQTLQERFWNDMDNNHVSGTDLLEEFSRSGKSRNFPVVFTNMIFDNELKFHRLDHQMEHWATSSSQVWLDSLTTEKNGSLHIDWDCREHVIYHEVLDSMIIAYENLLQALGLKEGQWSKKSLNLVTADNVIRIAKINKNEAENAASEELLHTGFINQAKITPNAVCCICQNEVLTYNQVLNLSSNISFELNAPSVPNVPSVQQEEMVAVFMDKGWEQLCIIGILLAGAAYLPISTTWPSARIMDILEKSNVKTIITQERYRKSNIDFTGYHVIYVTKKALSFDEPIMRKNITGSNLAYTIYTSGSTGEPKGVNIEHRAAVNTIKHVNRKHGINEKDSIFTISELHFDLSVYDIFGILSAGGKIVMPIKEELSDPILWKELLLKHNVTIWNSVPALLAMYMEYHPERNSLETLRMIWMSGDWIPIGLVKEIRKKKQNVHMISMGGATEASIWSIEYCIDDVHPSWKSIPYGYPMDFQKIYVYNKYLEDCPDYVNGDIYIGGKGLARGYYGDEQLTDKKFIIHPVSGERIYKTGDIGRYHREGWIEFIGREDFQVKINGYRIELEEIESVARRMKGVVDVIAFVRDVNGMKNIALYFTSKDKSVTEEALQNHLKNRLPNYMVPVVVMRVNRFKLTDNGKLDRNALNKLPLEKLSGRTGVNAERFKGIETLLDIYKTVLRLDKMDADKSFFYYGGNSISAMKLVHKIRQDMGKKINISDVFNYPDLSSMTEYLSGIQTKYDDKFTQPEGGLYQLSSEQEGIWLESVISPSYKFTLCAFIEIHGNLDVAVLLKAMDTAVRELVLINVKILVDKEDKPHQVVDEKQALNAEITDLTAGVHCEDDLASLEISFSTEIFDVDGGVLYHLNLVKINSKRYRLYAAFHHVICDDVSMKLFFERVIDRYFNGMKIDFKKLKINTNEYFNYCQGSRGKREISGKEHWSKLNELSSMVHLPGSLRTDANIFSGSKVLVDVEMMVIEKLKKRCIEQNATLQMGFLALFYMLIYKLTENTFIPIGMPITARNQGELDKTFGLLLNVTVVGISISGEDCFHSVLEKVKKELLITMELSHIPFSQVVRKLGFHKQLINLPYHLFFNYIERSSIENEDCDPAFSDIRYVHNTVLHDFGFLIEWCDQTCICSLPYKEGYILPHTASLFAKQFQSLIVQGVKEPDMNIHKMGENQ